MFSRSATVRSEGSCCSIASSSESSNASCRTSVRKSSVARTTSFGFSPSRTSSIPRSQIYSNNFSPYTAPKIAVATETIGVAAMSTPARGARAVVANAAATTPNAPTATPGIPTEPTSPPASPEICFPTSLQSPLIAASNTSTADTITFTPRDHLDTASFVRISIVCLTPETVPPTDESIPEGSLSPKGRISIRGTFRSPEESIPSSSSTWVILASGEERSFSMIPYSLNGANMNGLPIMYSCV